MAVVLNDRAGDRQRRLASAAAAGGAGAGRECPQALLAFRVRWPRVPTFALVRAPPVVGLKANQMVPPMIVRAVQITRALACVSVRINCSRNENVPPIVQTND